MALRVVQFGCGPIGCSIVRLAVTKPNIELVGAIDLVNVGRDLGEIVQEKDPFGISISNDPDRVLTETGPDMVLHATSSSLKEIMPQLETIIRCGTNIISTCEELAYPFNDHPKLAAEIHTLACENTVTVLGTGVNPGFLMDAWPLFMSSVCQQIHHIKAVRIQDASTRRHPFQKKIGAGTTLEEFKKLANSGSLRHVGLPESIAMIAAGLGWKLDKVTESIEPVIAQKQVRSDFVVIEQGQAAGVRQVGTGWQNGSEKITLDFQACIGARESYDAVYITGIPDLEVVVKGGVHGDLATAAMVINAIPGVMSHSPGLVTMKDLPILGAMAGP
ncbi:MAG: dihydrodipicolinate reductase [Deltaproteobacteria bacterium]|nr:dihydrodipicolinate reductase [Deltaproteobacteria bacterium]